MKHWVATVIATVNIHNIDNNGMIELQIGVAECKLKSSRRSSIFLVHYTVFCQPFDSLSIDIMVRAM
jgi:hypothetical protein